MRVFQNAGLYPAYVPRLDVLASGASTFDQRRDTFLNDSYGASHTLLPVLARRGDAFFTNADDEKMQRMWAREKGSTSRQCTLPDLKSSSLERVH